MVRSLILALVLASPLQAPPQKKVDESKVDAAIKKGVEWLKGGGGGARANQARELVLLALVHSGVRATDPYFALLLQGMLQDDLAMTYRVALQAMVLEELDRVKYQKRIFQCAQFLVDCQGANGQWSYGQPTTYPEPPMLPSKDVATPSGTIQPGQVVMFGDPGPGQKPAVRQKIPVARQREPRGGGDNSNSQYAALGLRACHDAGIILPKDVVERAQKWWRESQGDAAGSTAAKGWGYGHRDGAYGSMTAGAVGALSICDYILGVDWKRDDAVNAGVHWLRENFTVTENPGRKRGHHYYYLYGLERAGMLYGTEKFGPRDWYAEGAEYLIAAQGADGQWNGTVDTCFAILFLRRATRSLVESKDAPKPKK